MSYLVDKCCLCLKTDNVLFNLNDNSSDGIIYYNKLRLFLSDVVSINSVYIHTL